MEFHIKEQEPMVDDQNLHFWHLHFTKSNHGIWFYPTNTSFEKEFLQHSFNICISQYFTDNDLQHNALLIECFLYAQMFNAAATMAVEMSAALK